jgi:hypothetical protein
MKTHLFKRIARLKKLKEKVKRIGKFTLKKMKKQLALIKIAFQLPAIILHELSHGVAILLTLCKYDVIEWQWPRIKDNRVSYNFALSLDVEKTELKVFIVAIAPLFMMAGYLVFFLFLDWATALMAYCYFLVCFRKFALSESDIEIARLAAKRISRNRS